ncbi:MAG: carboxypeptidase-like regulatory domain-containing protein, partial [Verrucomicrobia bacterium]|nr:carboxypeptidase-like regulatory domain-containing protein [Verrucomicrobiota bacterium]
MRTNGTLETPLAVGRWPSWSRDPSADMIISNNMPVASMGVVTVTLPSLLPLGKGPGGRGPQPKGGGLGTMTALPIPPTPASALPPGYVPISGSPVLMNFFISTTATSAGPFTVCFTLTNVTDATTFDGLRVLHEENGAFVDRTLLPPDPQAPDFTAKTVCARVKSLGNFSVAHLVNPALPLITGRVVDSEGNPVSEVLLTLNDGGGIFARTDFEGAFAFANLADGAAYVVTPSDNRFDFDPPAELVEAASGISGLVFIAIPKPPPALSLMPNSSVPGAFLLSWPATVENYVLESTPSLSPPDWTSALEAPARVGSAWMISIQADTGPRFFRLRR